MRPSLLARDQKAEVLMILWALKVLSLLHSVRFNGWSDWGILIADMSNHRIRKLVMSTQIITTMPERLGGDGGPAKDAQLWSTRHVYYDKSTGDIYIVDIGNDRIRRVRDGKISTVVGKECTSSDG